MNKRKNAWTGGALIAAALSSISASATAATDTSAIEKRMQTLEQELQSLRDELAAIKAAEPAQTQQVQKLETRVGAVESTTRAPVKQLEERVAKIEQQGSPYFKHHAPDVLGNTIFFRGGHLGLTDDRGNGAFTDVFGLGTKNNSDSGWYAGAGFDFLLTRDVWGLLPDTWALAELSVEYGHVDSSDTVLVVPTAECAVATGNVAGKLSSCLITGDNNLSQLTVSASPKIRFWEGSRLRPWIIPAGLDFRVISPPSDSSAYLDVGAQFAAGADYELIPGIKIGADFRYHLAAGLTNPGYSAATRSAIQSLGLKVNEPDNDYWTAGGYLGIGF